MKLTRNFLALALSFSLIFLSFLTFSVQEVLAQDAKPALQRGYRTGYSDGYMAGYRDSIDNLSKGISRHREYADASRAYNKEYGAIEDYRDGYQQGFEVGYDTGFEKRSFESTIPTSLTKRGVRSAAVSSEAETPIKQEPQTTTASEPMAVSSDQPVAATTETATPITGQAADAPKTIQKISYTGDDAIILIPKDTELILEIQQDINTETSRDGEKFTAKVVSPSEINGAIIEGHVEKVVKPGRIKRRAELQLSFDRIVLSNNRWSNFNGILVEVLPIKGDNVRSVNNEGTAIGQGSIRSDSVKIGAATGAGAGIGAITAGPVGAAVGAGVGAAFGVGAVVIERGKHIRLNSNQQLRIRSSFETQIR